MTPYYADDWLTVFHGDCRAVMAEMEPESVHCVVTSPPYWGLRDYGDPGQLGLEPTPEEYVANLVAVFREVRRVLRKDGTVWLNLGDSYAGPNGWKPEHQRTSTLGPNRDGLTPDNAAFIDKPRGALIPSGLKAKDLVGIPWRVAFALQADGWYLRSDIIWSQPNPMPESVTDRPTKSHEYIFLLSKSARYFWDADAVREPPIPKSVEWNGYRNARTGQTPYAEHGSNHDEGRIQTDPAGRNIRSVWTVATAPYPGAHFATFPPKLIEPCIKAGTSERGVCPKCGAPWERETKVGYVKSPVHGAGSVVGRHYQTGSNGYDGAGMPRLNKTVETTGWRPSCAHISPLPPRPATILDPFAGSGTTGMVAQSLSRRAVLIDLSLDYLGQLMGRNADIPLGLGA